MIVTKRLGVLLLTAVLLLVAGCANRAEPKPLPTRPEAVEAEAERLLQAAPDEIWLYQDEMKVDTSAEPYLSELGLHYYPVKDFKTIEELQEHSRKLFTQDFCDNVLNKWSLNREKPRFIEHDGKLWECKGVGGLGWIQSLLINTVQLTELDLEQGRAVVEAFSQSMLYDFSIESFVLVAEEDGWKLDNYYHFNKSETRAQGSLLVDFIGRLNPASGSSLGKLIVNKGRETEITVEEEKYLEPFHALLRVLEYTPGSETAVKSVPVLDTSLPLVLEVGGDEYTLTFGPDSEVFVTTQDGRTSYSLTLANPHASSVVKGLVGTLRWDYRIH